MAKLFFDKHLLKQAGTLLLAPVGNGAFQSGSAPLPLLFRSSLTMQQLKIVEPGLKEMP
jgi:hypothetical protein